MEIHYDMAIWSPNSSLLRNTQVKHEHNSPASFDFLQQIISRQSWRSDKIMHLNNKNKSFITYASLANCLVCGTVCDKTPWKYCIGSFTTITVSR